MCLQNPTKKLTYWVDLLGQLISLEIVFLDIFKDAPSRLVLKIISYLIFRLFLLNTLCRCKCGQTDDEHSDNARKWVHSHTATWDPLVNTTTLPTNAYGEINFMAAENDILPLVR